MSESNGDWVDGRAFAGWLEGRRPDVRTVLSDSENRTLYRFRDEGGKGSLPAVDRLCVRLNLHIGEIPEWIWTERPGFGRRDYSPNQKAEAVAMFIDGASARDVAAELEIPHGTIKGWRREWIKREREAA